jgi:hypothetical protein
MKGHPWLAGGNVRQAIKKLTQGELFTALL